MLRQFLTLRGLTNAGGTPIKNQDKTITKNGTYTADEGHTGLGTVTVNVPETEPVIESLTVTENGTYTAPEGVDGYSPVTVNVAASGGSDIDALIDGSLTEITSNAESLRKHAFQAYSALTTANFPAATSIGTSAFDDCTALTTVNFPAATSIGSTAFRYCFKLTTVNILAATSIDYQAFYSCRSLTALILRSETMCTLANTNAFADCSHIRGTVHSTYNPDGLADGYIYVPRSLLSDTDSAFDYRQATNWSTYATQFRALEDYTVDGTITGELDPEKI